MTILSPEQLKLTRLVEGYFAAVDRRQVQDVLDYLAPDIVFRVATFDKTFIGRDGEVKKMFERLYLRYQTVWHGNFSHVIGSDNAIASQFSVENQTHDFKKTLKYNSNFFKVSNGKFTEIVVYMSGENSLE